MLTLVAQHQLLIRILCAPAGLLFAVLVTATALRHADTARHRSRRTARTADSYRPQHAGNYLGRHEADAAGTPVVLGQRVDGDITLVHADPAPEPAAVVRPADEPTVDMRALIGASA